MGRRRQRGDRRRSSRPLTRAVQPLAVAGLALAIAACDDKRRSRSEPPPPSPPAGSAAPAAAALSGTLWYIEERPPKLVRLARGTRTEVTSTNGDLFPSPYALPDGRLVAVASRGDGAADSEQLALVAPDGGVERIGFAAVSVRSPAVDPRGRWIVIAANADGHSDLYRVDLVAPGGASPSPPVRLTNDVKGNFAPALLGADSVVFASSRDGDSELYRMAVAPGAKPQLQRLTAFHRDDWAPAPAPDGKTIAFLSDREGRPRIFLVAADGTGLRRLTQRTDDTDETAPVWSPDGKSIAYLVERAGESNLWLRDVASGRERILTPAGVRDYEPNFSPDGAWLAISRGRGDHDGDLWAIPTTTGAAFRITSAPGSERLPRWR